MTDSEYYAMIHASGDFTFEVEHMMAEHSEHVTLPSDRTELQTGATNMTKTEFAKAFNGGPDYLARNYLRDWRDWSASVPSIPRDSIASVRRSSVP